MLVMFAAGAMNVIWMAVLGALMTIENVRILSGALSPDAIAQIVARSRTTVAAARATGDGISLAATLVFEQTYGTVEGDSASLAELCALLSSLGVGTYLGETERLRALKGEIASFKVPKRVHFVADLPRNAMGKVQKVELRNRYGALFKG